MKGFAEAMPPDTQTIWLAVRLSDEADDIVISAHDTPNAAKDAALAQKGRDSDRVVALSTYGTISAVYYFRKVS